MEQIKIFIEQHPNEEIRSVHLSRPVVAKLYDKYCTKPKPKAIEKLERRLKLCRELSDDGFDPVSRKELRIQRNMAFSWEQVEAAVIEIIKKHYRVDDVEVERMERNPEWDRPRRDRDDDY